MVHGTTQTCPGLVTAHRFIYTTLWYMTPHRTCPGLVTAHRIVYTTLWYMTRHRTCQGLVTAHRIVYTTLWYTTPNRTGGKIFFCDLQLPSVSSPAPSCVPAPCVPAPLQTPVVVVAAAAAAAVGLLIVLSQMPLPHHALCSKVNKSGSSHFILYIFQLFLFLVGGGERGVILL